MKIMPVSGSATNLKIHEITLVSFSQIEQNNCDAKQSIHKQRIAMHYMKHLVCQK